MAIYPTTVPNTGPTLYDPNTMTKVTQVVGVDTWDEVKKYVGMNKTHGMPSAVEAVTINNGYLVRLANVLGVTYCKTFKDIADLLVAEAAKRKLNNEQLELFPDSK
jgi:hypothetical protein